MSSRAGFGPQVAVWRSWISRSSGKKIHHRCLKQYSFYNETSPLSLLSRWCRSLKVCQWQTNFLNYLSFFRSIRKFTGFLKCFFMNSEMHQTANEILLQIRLLYSSRQRRIESCMAFGAAGQQKKGAPARTCLSFSYMYV